VSISLKGGVMRRHIIFGVLFVFALSLVVGGFVQQAEAKRSFWRFWSRPKPKPVQKSFGCKDLEGCKELVNMIEREVEERVAIAVEDAMAGAVGEDAGGEPSNPFYVHENGVGTYLCELAMGQGNRYEPMSCALLSRDRNSYDQGVQGYGCNRGDIRVSGKFAGAGSLGSQDYKDIVFVTEGENKYFTFDASLEELQGVPARVDRNTGEEIPAREGICEYERCREYQGKRYVLCYDLTE